jgi:hypothetical protein
VQAKVDGEGVDKSLKGGKGRFSRTSHIPKRPRWSLSRD